MAEKKSLKRQSSMSEDFGVFLHNPEKGTYCGNRNPEAWRKILGFYFIYYTCISGFWAICFAGMMANVPDRADGPLTQRSSGQSDVYAYAHIRTGNPQLFPISAAQRTPMEKDDAEVIHFSIPAVVPANGPVAQINKFFNDEYGQCAAAAVAAFQGTDACGPEYGFKSGAVPCFFIKMANVWDFPQKSEDTQIRCHYRQLNATGTELARIDVDIISFKFNYGADGCPSPERILMGGATAADAAVNGQYGSFQAIPYRGPNATPLQPVVAIKLAPSGQHGLPAQPIWQFGKEAEVFCDMPNVDQGQLVGGEPQIKVKVSLG